MASVGFMTPVIDKDIVPRVNPLRWRCPYREVIVLPAPYDTLVCPAGMRCSIGVGLTTRLFATGVFSFVGSEK